MTDVGGTSSSATHKYLHDEDMARFRTRICDQIQKYGKCDRMDRCPHSHCLAWQRRNPMEIPYWPELCPNISFVKKGEKMSLINNCTHRRRCKYAHSKEEQLYHPLTYKMKFCLAHPSCRRYFCPFAPRRHGRHIQPSLHPAPVRTTQRLLRLTATATAAAAEVQQQPVRLAPLPRQPVKQQHHHGIQAAHHQQQQAQVRHRSGARRR